MFAALQAPSFQQAVDGELTLVVAGTDRDMAAVETHIIDARRNHHAPLLAAEVVIEDLHRCGRVQFAGTGETPEQFLLFRVNSQHRLFRVQKFLRWLEISANSSQSLSRPFSTILG